MATWDCFYFDGCEYSGLVESKEKWRGIVLTYAALGYAETVELLRFSKRNHHIEKHVPVFCLYEQSRGAETLGQWADRNGVDLNL